MKKLIVIFGTLGLSSSGLSGTLMANSPLNPSFQTVAQKFAITDAMETVQNTGLKPTLFSEAGVTLATAEQAKKAKTSIGFKAFKNLKKFTKKAYKEAKKDIKDVSKKIGKTFKKTKKLAGKEIITIEKALQKKITNTEKVIEAGINKVEKVSASGTKDIKKMGSGIKSFLKKGSNNLKSFTDSGLRSIKNMSNSVKTILKEEGKNLKVLMKVHGQNIAKIAKSGVQEIKNRGVIIKNFLKEEGKNLKILMKNQGKILKTGLKKGAGLAYKGLKKLPRVLGQTIGEFTNGLVCALFGIAPQTAGIVLGAAVVGTIGYYAYNHSDEIKDFANSVVNTTHSVASSTTHYLAAWWPF